MAEKVVSVRLQARVEGFTAGMRKAKASVDDLTKADVPKAARGYKDLADKAALAGAAVAVGLGVAVKRFADFDAAMSAVKANVGGTAEEMDRLREAALQLGADSQFSATEAAQGINELGKAGVKTADILGGGLKGALDLAAAGQITVAQAAETTASAMTQFGLQGDDAVRVADLLANGANKAQGGVGDLGAALGQAGLVAAATGLSIEETAAGLTAFASAGLIGSDAGTSFKTMLQRLSAPSGEAAAVMAELGISAYDAQGNFVGLERVAGQLQAGMDDLTPAARNAAMATIFGSDAVRASNILYTEGAAGIAKWTDEVSQQGAAAEQAAALTDNLTGDIERLGGAFDSVLIETGSGANDSLRTIVQGLEGLLTTVGKIPGPLLLAGGGLAAMALVVPKGISAFQGYRATLDSVGLSLDKIAARGPRAAKGVEAAGKAAGVAGKAFLALAVASAAASVIGDDTESLGVQKLTGELTAAKDAVTAFNASLAGAATDFGAIIDDTDVDSFAAVLQQTFSPGVTDQAVGFLDAVTLGMLDLDAKANEAALRLTELDGVLSGLVSSGDAAGAASLFDEFAAAAEAQGVSVDDLKSKLPGYTEAVAGAGNAAQLAAGDSTALTSSTEDLADMAGRAEEAMSALRDAIDGLGSPTAAARAANREFQAAIDSASASIKENGATLDINTDQGRANEASLDAIRTATLDKVQADYELTGSTETATAAMQSGRDAFIDAAVEAGHTKAEANKLADQLGLIPKDVGIIVKQSGAEAAAAAVAAAAKDRTAWITVRTRIDSIATRKGDEAAGFPRKAGGGPIWGAGTKTSDSVPIWASQGEFMQKAAAVDKYGYGFMEAVNSLRFPVELARGLARGGPVVPQYAPPMQYAAMPSFGPASITETTNAPVYIGKVEGTTLAEVEREARQRARFSNLTGGNK